jgi:hypothetical protein
MLGHASMPLPLHSIAPSGSNIELRSQPLLKSPGEQMFWEQERVSFVRGASRGQTYRYLHARCAGPHLVPDESKLSIHKLPDGPMPPFPLLPWHPSSLWPLRMGGWAVGVASRPTHNDDRLAFLTPPKTSQDRTTPTTRSDNVSPNPTTPLDGPPKPNPPDRPKGGRYP